ncbi:MAG TPA: hypothetical protein VMX54_08945 [Vicinamibacteria bacterium]|nr:hypothetical protein [Vicinamibacteria bacterium]
MQDPTMPGTPAVVAPDRTLGVGGMSREGLVPAVLAVAGLCGGMALMLVFFRHYLDPSWSQKVALVSGHVGLVLAIWMTVRLARRGDYPWLMVVVAVALPLFEPQHKPDTLPWRMFGAAYGLVLVAVAVFAFVRMVARTDELERRVNQEALAVAFASSLVLAIAYSLFRELLPELQGVWVAAGMIATWLVGWNRAWRRYR